MAWSVSIGHMATKITGTEVTTWTSVLSPGTGTVVWGMFSPDLATMESGMDKLMTDATYAAELTKAEQWFIPGSVDDVIAQVVHGTPDPAQQPQYIVSVQAVCRPGGLGHGMSMGVEIAQRAEKSTGVPTMFLAASTGVFGGVSWISAYPDIAALEKAETEFYTDPATIPFLDSGLADAYLPGGTQTIYRRLG